MLLFGIAYLIFATAQFILAGFLLHGANKVRDSFYRIKLLKIILFQVVQVIRFDVVCSTYLF